MCTTGEADPLQLLRAGLAGLVDTDPRDLTDTAVLTELPVLLAAANQITAVLAARVGTLDTRDLAPAGGYRSTRAWLCAHGRMTQAAASGHLSRARLLPELPALAGAAESGAVSAEHLARVAALTDKVGVAAVKPFDTILADLASLTRPGEVDKACQRILAHLDPDGAPPDPQADFAKRDLTLSRHGAMLHLRGRLDPEAGAALHTALDALMKPPTGEDERTPGQRRADALTELARQALSQGQLPTIGGVRPHLGLLITPTTLLDTAEQPTTTATATAPAQPHQSSDPGCPATDPLTAAGIPAQPEPPWLSWIGEIPPELAQRISCDCEVWRAVLDPATGLPLEVGRTHRIVPPWIRKALHARDRGCRWPGCDAPTAWTDAHHLIAWYLGGPTDIDNLLLLCRWHHARVHEGHWRIILDHKTGEVRVIKPDGQLFEVGPSRPWTGPNTQRGDPERDR